ncbi:MAG: hypothetical protein KAH86_02140 [Methanosarcinales archaeon]|nr:hypothetical protein [Methanosarcinales archaeon]
MLRNVENIYGIKGKFNIHSWNGLLRYILNQDAVTVCKNYASCDYELKQRKCRMIVPRRSIINNLQSRLEISETIAERLIEAMMTKEFAHNHKCDGTKMVYFDD